MTEYSPGFRNILVATDFSESADAALRQGIWLGEKSHAKVVVAHVLTDLREAFAALPYAAKSEFLYGDIEKFERALRAESQKKLTRSVRRFAKKVNALKTEVLLGRPEIALTYAVHQEKYDIVVAGTRGLTGLKRVLLGSTAQRLVRICPAPVWVVKAGSVWPPKRLLVGIDFSDLSRRALGLAGWLASHSKAFLDVVHVIEADDVLSGFKPWQREQVKKSDVGKQIEADTNDRLKAWCAETLAPSSLHAVHVHWGTPWKVLVDRSRRWRCDLVILGAVGRSGLSGILVGNTAEKMLNHHSGSILTVKSPEFVSPIPPPFWDLHPADEPRPIGIAPGI